MVILLLLQLFWGGALILGVFGILLNSFQNLFNPKYSILLILLNILTAVLYCFLAYYFSEAIDIYVAKHGGKTFVIVMAFLVLILLLFGPVKFVDTQEQGGVLILSGLIAIVFFAVIRFIPSIGETMFGWIPVYVFV